MAGTYLLRTPSSSTNNKTCTLSVWIKRSAVGVRQAIASQTVDGSNETFIWFDTNDELFLKESGEATYEYRTNRKFRDVSAWYHIVMAIDTTQSTASDRVKLYINGVRETSFAASTAPALNDDTRWNSTTPFNIGRMNYGSEYFNGLMSTYHWIDGTAYDASTFGSTDATTGEWKIIVEPSVNYGTNGFFILKNSGSKTDESGNGNNFSEEGSPGIVSNTKDCPSNVFATFNPLNQTTVGTNVYFYGNTDLDSSTNANEFHGASTLGMTSGKYYAEFKMKSGQYNLVGITSSPSNDARTNTAVRNSANSYGLYSYNGKLNTSTYAASYTTPNIIGVAVDLDNNKIYFSKDGNWATGSGAWGSTTWSSSTGAFTITDPSLTVEGAYFFAIGDADAGSSGKFSANFGNGYQATTAVSSAGTNASGNGIFEYDTPTGFTALSTKGLNL